MINDSGVMPAKQAASISITDFIHTQVALLKRIKCTAPYGKKIIPSFLYDRQGDNAFEHAGYAHTSQG